MNKLLDETKSAQKCDNLSDFIDTYFTEPVAMLCSRVFLKFKIHPNTVTILSTICGIACGVTFLFHNLLLNIIGILLLVISIIFDTSDGQVARLGTKRSKYGRWLDGLGDTLVYSAIYFGVAVHLMSDKIPFTDVTWGWWIWIFAVVCGLYFHSSQAKMADYYRNAHMYFIDNARGTSLERSRDIKKEYVKYKHFTVDRFFKQGSYSYTLSQERRTPKMQMLLDAIENDETDTKIQAKNEVAIRSSKIVRKTNLLTVNVRSYVLSLLVLLNQYFFIFPFILLVLEPINVILICKYEKIAKDVYNKYYSKNLVNEDEVKI